MVSISGETLRNGTVLKARTVLTSGGTRINWNNVSYFEIASEDDTSFHLNIYWKYKASIKTERIKIPINTNMYTYFKKFGIVQFGSKYINIYKIITIDEREKHGPVEKTIVRIVFTDGFQVVETLETSKWIWWKNTYA